MGVLKNTGKALADIVPGLGRLTFDPSLGTVFITSGSGAVGYRVAMRLLAAGHENVRVGIWRGDRDIGSKSLGQKCAEELEAKGAEIVDFDWSKDDDFENAISGVKTVFCTIPNIRGWQDAFPAFLRACKKAKVEHFVKISFFHSNLSSSPYQDVPFVRFHGTCDDILEGSKNDSRISYTILRSAHMMSTPFILQGPALSKERKFYTASYGMGVNYVSPNDVADAALVVLFRRKEHRNKTYTLTGTAPIKDKDVCKLISDFYGAPIEHVPLGYHEYKEYMLNSGHPEWLVKDAAEMEKIKASGIDEKRSFYTNDLANIIGKKPETYADYLKNKESMTAAWQWPTEEQGRAAKAKELL